MKRIITKTGRLAALGLAAMAGSYAAQAQTVDGTRGGAEGYGTALAVQTNSTGFADNTQTNGNQSNGSEVDNIHAQIVGSNLYLFIGGNLQDNFNKLDLFFDTKPGGQNTLANNGSNYVRDMNGLQFDAGFAADYALELTTGNASATAADIYVNYANLPTAGGGTSSDYIGGGTGRIQTVTFSNAVPGAGTGTVALDNSNAAGVTSGAASAAAATAVATGAEYVIPLTALGTTVSGGDIKIIAFINGSGRNFLSNQVLAGLTLGTSNLGPPSGVNFASQAGNQFVTVANGAVVTPADISVSPLSLSFYNVATAGGSVQRTVTITNNGGSTLNVTSITSNNTAFTVSATSATLAPAASTNVTVTFDPSVPGSQSGTISIASNDPGTPVTTVAVSGTGIAPGNVVLDGTVDGGGLYTQKALQTTATQFGDNQSELDGAYVRTTATDLYVTLTGNLENNGNKLVIFFDANPTTGQNTYLGTNPTSDNSGALTGMRFDRGFAPESFVAINLGGASLYASYVPLNGAGGFGTYLSTTGNDLTQTLTFSPGVTGELSLNNSNTGGVTGSAVGTPGAVQTGIELRIPLSVLGAGITSTTPLHVMPLITNGGYDYLSNQTLGGLPGGTGNLGSDGAGGGGTANSVDFLNYAGNQFFTAQRGDVSISNARDLAGDYRNISIASPFGNATVYSPLNVSGTLTANGTLQFSAPADAIVSGTGSTVINGNLVVTSPAGISASGATGNVQTTGRSFGSTAQYAYGNLTGTPMVTGTGLPGTVVGLAVGTAASLTLTNPVAVSGTVALTSTGNLNTNGNALTLLSSAAGTALVDNLSTGVVNGTATVQRYVDPSLNPNGGYRHFSAPVANTTLADLTTTYFTPITPGAAYNNATNSGAVRPFPNIFTYDESRVLTSPSTTLNAFDKGWTAPNGTSDSMSPMQGFTVNIGATSVEDFVGTLNNGDISRSLPRTGGAAGGWHLVGNPYPAPLDYSLVSAGDRTGLDGAMYVFESTSTYGGNYRTYLTGAPGTGNPLLALGQGFFVHTTTPGVSGSLTLRNAQRVTSAATQQTFRRDAAETRPYLQLALAGAGQSADGLTLYADRRATTGIDAQYDALKLPNTSGLNLAALAAGTELTYNALPAFAQGLLVPLAVRVPAAGTYTLTATALANLPAGLPLYLRDALTGQQTDLRAVNARYTFTVTAAQAATLATGRFSLAFAPAGALAATAALEANGVRLFPNPAHGSATLLVPAVAGASQLSMGLYNALGQRVRSYPSAALPAAGLSTTVDVSGVAAGLYTLRLTAGGATISKKLAVE